MGLSEIMPLTHYRQTIGGDYSSRPKIEDVVALLISGDRSWEAAYANRGHNEYIDNVHDFVEMADRLHFTVEDCIQNLSLMQPEYR